MERQGRAADGSRMQGVGSSDQAISDNTQQDRTVPTKESVSVIIPAYNEESSVGTVIAQVGRILTQAAIPNEIIVVDDGSGDQTVRAAQRTGARVLCHEKNRGYGAALKTGIRASQYELLMIIDADGTYPAECIPDLLDQSRTADMVVGARVRPNAAIPLVRQPAKWMLRRLAEYLTNERIPDLNSGLRVFPRQLIQQYLDILPDKFSFTTTATVALLCDHYTVRYVPIEYYKRAGKSKIVPWDFFNFLTLVLRLSMLFHPLKIFVPVAFTCTLIGGVKFCLDIVNGLQRFETLVVFLQQPVVSTTTVMFFLAALQILLIGMISDGLIRKVSQLTQQKYQSRSTEKIEQGSQ